MNTDKNDPEPLNFPPSWLYGGWRTCYPNNAIAKRKGPPKAYTDRIEWEKRNGGIQ